MQNAEYEKQQFSSIIRPNEVKVCLPCGAADKTSGLFPRFLDSSFVIYFSLSLFFKKKKKNLISMKLWGGKPVLYMKEKDFLASEMHMEILQQVQFVCVIC